MLSEVIRKYGGEETTAAYFKKYILNPLEMSRSRGDYIWNDDKDGNTNDFYHNATVFMGSGGLKSTVNDMTKYICMYMNMGTSLNGNSIISPEFVNEMTTKRITTSSGRLFYGYGLNVTADGLPRKWHSGGSTGITAYMAWSYIKGIGIIVLCNTNISPEKISHEIGTQTLLNYCR